MLDLFRLEPTLETLAVLIGGMIVIAAILILYNALPSDESGKEVDPKTRTARQAAYRPGILVLVALAVLTIVEYWIASALDGSVVFLFVIALVKAGLILQYFMHLGTLWSEEAHS